MYTFYMQKEKAHILFTLFCVASNDDVYFMYMGISMGKIVDIPDINALVKAMCQFLEEFDLFFAPSGVSAMVSLCFDNMMRVCTLTCI